MRKVLITVACGALLFGLLSLTAAHVAGAEGEQDISGTVRGLLRSVTIAVDQGTGNAVVVFNQSHKKKQEKGKIWLVELILQPNGSYQAGDPILVSSKKGSNQRPHVIPFYSSGAAGAPASSLDYFVIIWDTGPKRRFDPSWSPKPSTIMMRGYFPTWVASPGPHPTSLGKLHTLVDEDRLELYPKGVHFGDFGNLHILMVYYYSTSLDLVEAPTVAQASAPPRTDASGVVPAGDFGSDQALRMWGFDLNLRANPVGPGWGSFAAIEGNFRLKSDPIVYDSSIYLGVLGKQDGQLISGLGCHNTINWVFGYTPLFSAPKDNFFNPRARRIVVPGVLPTPISVIVIITNVWIQGPRNYRTTIFDDCNISGTRKFLNSGSDGIDGMGFYKWSPNFRFSPPAKSKLKAVYHTADGRFHSRQIKPNGKAKKKEKVLPWATKQDRFGGMDVDSFGKNVLIAYVEYKNNKRTRSTVKFGAARL